jgi:hypothetical protein
MPSTFYETPGLELERCDGDVWDAFVKHLGWNLASDTIMPEMFLWYSWIETYPATAYDERYNFLFLIINAILGFLQLRLDFAFF